MPVQTVLSKDHNVHLAVSEISDGNMSYVWGEPKIVLDNRIRFLGKSGIAIDTVIAMKLEHSDNIVGVVADSGGDGMRDDTTAKVTDCLITQSKGLFLFVITADCMPIIFFDPVRYILALAHISRKNTDLKFGPKVVDRFKSLGSDLADISVYIGPAVQKQSYVFDYFDQPGWKKHIYQLANGKYQIDMVGYNIAQLIDAGIPKENIETSPIDTGTSSEFYSHCRSARTGEPEGRFATVVGML
jgi:hypothetical protein